MTPNDEYKQLVAEIYNLLTEMELEIYYNEPTETFILLNVDEYDYLEQVDLEDGIKVVLYENGLDSVEDFMDTIQEATVNYLAMANYCYIIEGLGMVMS